jgi:mRNA interferase MazF
MTYKWYVFMADLNPVIGSEQQGRRPVLVISDETTNSVMPILTKLLCCDWPRMKNESL